MRALSNGDSVTTKMFRLPSIVLASWLVCVGCATTEPTPADDDGGTDASPPTQTCSCPCQQIQVSTAQHCWTTSC